MLPNTGDRHTKEGHDMNKTDRERIIEIIVDILNGLSDESVNIIYTIIHGLK